MNKEICWNITARCNQGCKYCHRFLNVKDLSYEDNLTILNNLINAGVTNITFTGGEALLLPGVDDLMEISYNKGIKNKLITNGKLLTKERISKIHKYLDSITISIDSKDNDINEELGRGYNHFDEVKDILDYVKNNNIDTKIMINSVICKQNIDTFSSLIDFLNNYNIYSWRIFKFMPLRETAVTNKDCFDITMDKYDNLVKEIKEKSNITKIDTRIQSDMEKKYVLILADGSIMITENGQDKKMGNALTDSISKLL